METPDFIPPRAGCKSSRLQVWSVMQEKVYKKWIKDIDELCARILTSWDKMDQGIIDKSINQSIFYFRQQGP